VYRIPLHTLADAPEASREALSALAGPDGEVLNTYRHMAASSGVLHGYLALRSVVDRYATLDTRVQEAIALAVANENGCGYDEAAHTAAAERAGLDHERILSIRRGDTAFDPALGALLRVVREMVSNVGIVSDVTWKAAREAGWSESLLAELPLHVALHTYTTTFNRWAGTEVDFPHVPEV
jgi:AhpD family alkylhydroperoxidase